MNTVCVFGGTGFLGRRLVRRLAGEGASVRVAVRSPERARGVLELERVEVQRADVREPASVAAAVAGCDAVVNAVSAYVEKAGVSFESVHVEGARTLAQESLAAGVSRLVLVSGIGADPESASAYIRARGQGELAAREAFPGCVVVRPGAMFGPGDALFAGLADIVRVLPVVPLIGGGGTRVQPVYVEDVAEAIARVLAGSSDQTYELAGPGVYSLRELVEYVLRLVGKRRLLVPLPFVVAEVQARLFELLPSPPLTTGQVDLLRRDNLAGGELPGLSELGIQGKAVEEIVPSYVGRQGRRGAN